ncbi:sodium stibogluconate resistance protein [Trypanosoma theileri]|uniref:Sodium stibogluconate resistance protein n=1 Tax=Trypanosoma theileri TaxID=67003 RepID=A0A1X0NMF0_9TRYP|nr:sodium stibogluconate resistance protein [Trypanosoma theileri]ORC85300.1 sodium stibogluconate resistance protein [Trypanosoma theileri]
MGSGASAEEHRHSRLFREGYKALLEGRYTYAEIYYDQAIERHEGHAFWSRIDNFIEWERKPDKGERKKVDGKNESSTTAPPSRDEQQSSSQQEQEEKKEEDDVIKPTDEEMSDGEGKEMEEQSNVLEFPLDGRLITVLEYLQLRADIADSYMLAGRLEEAAPHVDYISIHTEAAMRCLQIARDKAAGEENNGGNANPLDNLNAGGNQRRPRLGMMTEDPERDSILDCLDQHLRLHWVSSTANGVYIAFERFRGGQGEKKRKKELDAAVLTCLRVEEALFNFARRRAKSLTNAVVLSFLEALIEDLDADSSCSSEPEERNSKRTKSKNKLRGGSVDETPNKGNNTSVSNNKSMGNRSMADASVMEPKEAVNPMIIRLQILPDRKMMCRSVPAPQQGAALRHVPWMDEEIRRVVPGTNYHLEIQCGMVDDKRKKQLQKRALKFIVQTKCDYNDRVLLGKSFDEENALLLFPVLLIQADVQLELGAATKGIQALDLVDKLATQLYGMESLERQSLMRRVTECRKRGGALFMMFED